MGMPRIFSFIEPVASISLKNAKTRTAKSKPKIYEAKSMSILFLGFLKNLVSLFETISELVISNGANIPRLAKDSGKNIPPTYKPVHTPTPQ